MYLYTIDSLLTLYSSIVKTTLDYAPVTDDKNTRMNSAEFWLCSILYVSKPLLLTVMLTHSDFLI